MKTLIRSPYAKLYFAGLIVFVITSYFSLGYHHPDEHFQVLEFANVKMGNSPASDLPWEYQAKIRPAIQPLMALVVIRSLNFVGMRDPFTEAFILRLITALLAWFIICRMDEYLIRNFKTVTAKRLFILMSLFLWFVPYIFVRFSSETMAGIALLYGVFFLLRQFNASERKRAIDLWAAGFCFGLSFFFRFQMGFAILGVGVWLLFIHRINWKAWLALIGTALAGVALCICIDYWFYQEWVLTPVRYFEVNILQNKAADWGVQPWWYYLSIFSMKAVPPVSVVLLLLFLTGIYRKWSGVFVFIIVPFLFVHFLLGHKEIRFLFPVAYPFLYLAAVGSDYLIEHVKPNKLWRYGYVLLIAINSLLLMYVMFAPAETTIKAYKQVYWYAHGNPAEVLCVKKDLYKLAGLEVNFYKPIDIEVQTFDSLEAIGQYLERVHPESALIYLRKPIPDPRFNGYTAQLYSSMLPGWLLKFNLNHWQNRAAIWSIYQLKKMKCQ
jgi:GPI mannosyltransferase 3